MKAIVMTQPGDPDVLKLEELPTPKILTDTQVLVRIKAAGVNPIDTKIRRRGTFFSDPMPAILGCDGAGIIEAVGDRVSRFQPNDEVYFFAGGLGKKETGNYAEFTVLEERLLARKPTSLSFAEAAAAPLALITAWESLYDRGRVKPEQKVLIHAGAGGVGHIAIQLAKLEGAYVATTVSSPDKERLVRHLGADYPIFYQKTDFVKAALDWTGGNGVDLAFDTVGGKTFYNSCEAVKIYGNIVTILEPNLNFGNLKNARKRNLRISLVLMLTPSLNGLINAQLHQTEILKQCATWIDEGKLKIHLSQTFPLDRAAAAHRALETGSTTGKIVLSLD